MLLRTELKLQQLSSLKFKLLLIALASIRVGISPIGQEWVGWLVDAAKAFPESANYISYSPLPVLLMKILSSSNPFLWWSIWLIIDLTWLYICMVFIEKKYPKNSRFLQTIFMMSQLVTVNLTMIGHYDNLIFIAITLLIFFKSRLLIFLSACIAAGANPYLSFAAGICLLFYYLYTRNKQNLSIALYWSIVSLVFLIGTNFFLTAPNSGTRQSIVLGQFAMVIKGVVGVWWYLPFSVFGALTLIYFILLFDSLKHKNSLGKLKVASFLIGSLIIPVAMAYLILDHTRIGVAAGSAVLLLLIFEKVDTITSFMAKLNLQPISSLIVLWVLTYPVIVDSAGVFRLPYEKFASLIW